MVTQVKHKYLKILLMYSCLVIILSYIPPLPNGNGGNTVTYLLLASL